MCGVPAIPWESTAGMLLGVAAAQGGGPLLSIPQSLLGGPWTKYKTEVPSQPTTSNQDCGQSKATSQDTGFISSASRALSSLGSKIQSFFARGCTMETQVTNTASQSQGTTSLVQDLPSAVNTANPQDPNQSQTDTMSTASCENSATTEKPGTTSGNNHHAG